MTTRIVLFVVVLILTTMEIYSNKVINLKRGVILFISTIIVPFIIGYVFKITGIKINRENLMIMFSVVMSIWVLLTLISFPYLFYGMYRLQTEFHKKYNNLKHVGKNLEELGTKENLATAHKVIKIFCILSSYLMLYGVWFGTK